MGRRIIAPRGKPVIGATKLAEDKLYMICQLEQQFEALNVPLAVRKGAYQFRYTDHFPSLWVRTAHGEEELCEQMNTRTKRVTSIKPKHESNLKMCEHVREKLAAIDCNLMMAYDIDPKSQRKRVKLLLVSKHATLVRHTLHWLWKGEVSPWIEHFEVPIL